MSRFVRPATCFVLSSAVLVGSSSAQTPLGTSFTYQGRLAESGSPASGAYDLRFILYDAPAGGNQVGPVVTRDDVVVSTGLFTIGIDFGAVFAGARRFLEVGVRPGASTGAYDVVSGRQELTAAPSALFGASAPWAGITGKPAGFADGLDNDTTYTAGQGINIVGTSVSVSTLGITTAMLGSGVVISGKIGPNAVGNAEVADNAIGNAEMASNAIGSAEIAGTEVALYQVNPFCGSSALTLAGTCQSQQCAPALFFTCAGACTTTVAVTCANTLRGYLLSPTIP